MAAQGVIAITGGTLIDGRGGSPLVDAVIVLNGDRIQAVGRKGQVAIPAGTTVIDATGKTIIPGLIDGHVHFRPWKSELNLVNGVTTLIDLGNADEWMAALVQASNSGRLRSPRLFSSGSRLGAQPSIRSKRLFKNVAADKPHFIFRDVAGALPRIQQKKRFGLSVLKVDEIWAGPELKAVVDAAHAAGLPVVGHATDPRELRFERRPTTSRWSRNR